MSTSPDILRRRPGRGSPEQGSRSARVPRGLRWLLPSLLTVGACEASAPHLDELAPLDEASDGTTQSDADALAEPGSGVMNGAVEVCDGVDNDGDGKVDNDDPDLPELCEPATDLRANETENWTIVRIAERSAVTITASDVVRVDHLVDLSTDLGVEYEGDKLMPTNTDVLPPGTYDSTLLHFDVSGNAKHIQEELSFDFPGRRIVAVIWSNWDDIYGKRRLNESDPFFALPGVTMSTWKIRALEGGDIYRIDDADTLTITSAWVKGTTGLDDFRILTCRDGDGDGACDEVCNGVDDDGDGVLDDCDIDEMRSLFDTDERALAPFTMEAVLDAVAVNAGLTAGADDAHDQLMDTYNEGPGLGMGSNCDDALLPGGEAALNGYPLECPRDEGNQVGNIEDWVPLGVVNRFDLAPADGSHCGEARLVMVNDGPGLEVMYTIFEAQIPNPSPGCGLDACAPVQRFWAGLSQVDDPLRRATELRLAFLDGHPTLEAAGFGPFLSKDNFAAGTGQVRTNNFDQFPWTLREFEAVEGAGGVLRFEPVPVAGNPFGDLWNDGVSLEHSSECQDALVDSVQHLLTDDPNLMGMAVPSQCLAAESPDDATQNYPARLAAGGSGAGSLQQRIQDELDVLGSTLTPADIAERARFVSCIGCHQRSNGKDLGNGVFAPASAGFVHTDKTVSACADGSGAHCFGLSPALEGTFLPFRKGVVDAYLDADPGCGAP